ncbi:hypothetical protein QUF75_15890 [Desulfococcaceae bacterium HSG7]|nr:hypothetical protein [Desulfococcaceae bacterium HSG9]MDM8556205.1 hypothetical protein [Desulfococcaceae bacterium HSG7]
MGLKYKFNQAKKILNALDPEALMNIRKIGRDIQRAEEKLTQKGKKLFLKCKTECHGLCCRNLQPDSIISLYDFLFILLMNPELHTAIAKCLENENIFYTSDCIFLKDGKGPCIFPPDSMPEICITSFCGYEYSIEKEINHLKRKFIKFIWLIFLHKQGMLKNKVVRWFKRN